MNSIPWMVDDVYLSEPQWKGTAQDCRDAPELLNADVP